MKPRQFWRLAASISLVIGAPSGFAQSANEPTVRSWIGDISSQINRISLTTGDWTQQRQIEEAVATKIRERVRADPEHPSLVDKTSGGSTVLMHASLNGYALVVEALLESSAVRRELEVVTPQGATAWGLANFAFKQVAWVCVPSLLSHENPIQSAQYLIQSRYFDMGPENQYARIRKALADAGARTDVEAAKKAWLANCPPARPETVLAVQSSTDLLQTLLSISAADKTRFLAKSPQLGTPIARAQEGESAVEAFRPRPQPIPAAPSFSEPPLQSWEKSGALVCKNVQLPRRPEYEGQLRGRYEAQVEVRNGKIFRVDMRVLEGNQDRRLQRSMVAAIGEVVRAYDCPGTFSFAQVFEFR